MNDVAERLIDVAEGLCSHRTAGSWRLPEWSDVQVLVAVVKRMEQGKWPSNSTKGTPLDMLRGIIGDDDLYDRIGDAEERYLKECARAVRDRVGELALRSRDEYGNDEWYDVLQELKSKL